METICKYKSIFLFGSSVLGFSWGGLRVCSGYLGDFGASLGVVMAASLASCDAVFLRGILADLGHPQSVPTPIRIDSSSAIAVAKDPVHHAKSKHILRRDLYIRELYDAKIVVPKYVPTAQNPADIFTKQEFHIFEC